MMHTTPVYLDCNATAPMEEEVLEAMMHFFRTEYGNAGSRTHRYGTAASQAVRRAREQIAAVVNASWESIVFTSGATESNNLALLGSMNRAALEGKRHIISTQIEHKAVLEPLEVLKSRGFEVTLLPPNGDGVVPADSVRAALRPDTALVSVMHVNNETGVLQPIAEIAEALGDHAAAFHTDAAQGFGKELDALRHHRIDFISLTSHKIYGPKGVAALVARSSPRTKGLAALTFGGGQEWGLRPGTLPVPLIVGLGLAAEMAVRDHAARRARCLAFRQALFTALAPLQPVTHGDPARTLPHVANLRFDTIDSEAVMLALRDELALSNGSACTSSRYEPSHVLAAMGLSDEEAQAATRWSWCHLTPQPDWPRVVHALQLLY